MTPKEANRELINVIKKHLIIIQYGEFGTPTIEDLQFCGKLHKLLEETQ